MTPRIPHAVAVLDGSRQHVSNRLDAAVGVPRETGQVICRYVVAEVVKEEKGVEVGRVAEPERTAQMHARTFEGRLGLDEPLDRSNGHSALLNRDPSPVRHDATSELACL